MKTEQEMRAEFEQACRLWMHNHSDMFQRASKNHPYFTEGHYIYSQVQACWIAWQARQPEIDARDEEIANLKEINKSQKIYEEKLETQIKLLEKQNKLREMLTLSNELSISLHEEVNCKKDAEIVQLHNALSALINAKKMKQYNYSGYEQAKERAWEMAYKVMERHNDKN